MIKARELLERRVILCAFDLPLSEPNGAVEVAQVARAQEFVLQHRAERGREIETEFAAHAIADESLQHHEKRDVGFGDGFEEPILFQEFFVFRVPHERQVRVEDERERRDF